MGSLYFTPVTSLLFGLCALLWLVLIGWVGWRWLMQHWHWPWPIVVLVQGILAAQIYWFLGLMALNEHFPASFLPWLGIPGSILFFSCDLSLVCLQQSVAVVSSGHESTTTCSRHAGCSCRLWPDLCGDKSVSGIQDTQTQASITFGAKGGPTRRCNRRRLSAARLSGMPLVGSAAEGEQGL